MSPVIYANPLACAADLADWLLEGPGALSFPRGRLRLESQRPMGDGQAANLVLWCPLELPDRIRISWSFRPLCEPGLAMAFFAARGRHGGSIFAPECAARSGPYQQYHSGDLDALHVSFFRRRNPDEVVLHTCNLRKSHGFHLVAQGADPLPGVFNARPDGYRMVIEKDGPEVRVAIAGLEVLHWRDPGVAPTGAVLGGGWFGLRQMSPLIAEHHDLVIEHISTRPPA